ncbi:MORN repeat-containing protein 3-like [Rhinophrynus dorsalis]
MPTLKAQRTFQPVWKENDVKAKKSGLLHTVYSVNGDHYKGEWYNDLKHGHGTYIYKSKNAIYEGEWYCGKKSGFGVYSVLNSRTGSYVKVYSGNWRQDQKHGYGTQYYGPNETYEGEWLLGKRSGKGRMIYANGDVYTGEWLEDKPSGHGTLLFANGDRYEGSWKNGKRHGEGKFSSCSRQQQYEGVWMHNVAKCGTLTDIRGTGAISRPKLAMPKLKLAEPSKVLKQAQEDLKGPKPIQLPQVAVKPAGISYGRMLFNRMERLGLL